MKVIVTGATGTIGRAAVKELLRRGDEVAVLSRDAGGARSSFGGRVEAFDWKDPKADPPPTEALAGRDGVLHLLGEPVAQRWSEDAKSEIRDSRVLATRNLVAALKQADPRPAVLVSQSAAGWYGARGDERVDESEPPADDFLAEVCVEWEAEARGAEELGIRVATTRTGVILSESGGALEKMLPPFKLGVGGPVAGGRQYVPWIHLDDVAGALAFCLSAAGASGPVNLSAPEPVTNKELSKTLGRVLRRPAVAPVPGLAVKLLYGDMARVVTTGVTDGAAEAARPRLRVPAGGPGARVALRHGQVGQRRTRRRAREIPPMPRSNTNSRNSASRAKKRAMTPTIRTMSQTRSISDVSATTRRTSTYAADRRTTRKPPSRAVSERLSPRFSSTLPATNRITYSTTARISGE